MLKVRRDVSPHKRQLYFKTTKLIKNSHNNVIPNAKTAAYYGAQQLSKVSFYLETEHTCQNLSIRELFPASTELIIVLNNNLLQQ